jgi:hypothetical protein
MTRHRFAYAPLRQVDRFEIRQTEISSAIDWHTALSGRSSALFDAVSIATFAAIGLLLTWYARNAMPANWISAGIFDPLKLSLVRIVVSVSTGIAVFALAGFGARLGLLEMPLENRWLVAVKFAAAAILGAGVLFIYRDPSIGLVPMVGLSLIAMVLLFRMDPADALKASVAMAMISLPIYYAVSVI